MKFESKQKRIQDVETAMETSIAGDGLINMTSRSFSKTGSTADHQTSGKSIDSMSEKKD
ncbi:MAG: hypothetical protein Q8920_13820 [Bacillota bacterium]|nr:hypothetical protein [Bacillota bacterium]